MHRGMANMSEAGRNPAGDDITLARDGATVIITMARPKHRNAFTPDMRRQMAQWCAELHGDSSCRVIIITGEGGHFCSGADLSRVDPNIRQTPLSVRRNFREMHQLIDLLHCGPKPVIAAIEGVAWGAGLSMALACDHVVAAENARFGVSFTALGIMPDMGMLYSLRQRVGLSAARNIAMLGMDCDGREAAGRGLVDVLVQPGAALSSALALAARYEGVAPIAVAFTKAAYANGMETLEDAFRAERDLFPTLVETRDFKAAISAFKAKTKPVFTGE